MVLNTFASPRVQVLFVSCDDNMRGERKVSLVAQGIQLTAERKVRYRPQHFVNSGLLHNTSCSEQSEGCMQGNTFHSSRGEAMLGDDRVIASQTRN